ncbi:MAG: tetratricopeptide repeat protein [Cytophagales bacterium]|nr:tetratricopeptide repeat protein [Armatimonadota bacterium]
MTGCSPGASTGDGRTVAASVASPLTTDTSATKGSPKGVISGAGEKISQALFGEGRGVAFEDLQSTTGTLQAASADRRVTLAELPKPSFSLKENEKGSGPGVLVFEPVPEIGTDPALADFAAGCSDWLFFTVGGQPQTGQTPLLTSVSRAQRELKLTRDLRLGLDDARRIAAATGASHVVVGALGSAGSGKSTLTYTLYKAEAGKAVGKSLAVSGSPESIRRQLPQVAVELSKQLGIPAPHLPAQTDATVSDLISLGRVVWREAPREADIEAVSAAAPRVALATLCRLTQERFASGTQFQSDAALLLTKLAPENTLGWGHAAYMNAAYLTPQVERLAALRRRYPRSYALAHADVWMNRSDDAPRAERRAAEDAVRAAPRNPDAWLSLGWTVSEEAHRLRIGRSSDRISPDEWRFLRTVYPLWERAVARATELDPQHELAWTRLAQAATFSGSRSVAEAAFAKAETLSADKQQVYEWGLQMFQEKWGGQKSDLDRVAEGAANTEYKNTQSAGYIAVQLREAGYSDQADKLMNRWIATIDDLLAKNPNDPYAHWKKASLLFYMGRKPAACREYETVTKLLPKNAEAQYAYAETLLSLGADVRSIPEYRRVLELDPQNAYAPLKLGSGLKHAEKWEEAEKWYKIGIARLPNYGNGHLALAELYQWGGTKRRHAEAAREYIRCKELGGNSVAVYAGGMFALADSGKAPEAVRWGEEAWKRYGGGQYSQITGKQLAFLRAALGYAYLKSKRYQEAVEEGEAVLKMAPDDPNAHQVLGDAYNFLKQRRNARTSWNFVVETVSEERDPEGVGHARQMLAKYPENGT